MKPLKAKISACQLNVVVQAHAHAGGASVVCYAYGLVLLARLRLLFCFKLLRVVREQEMEGLRAALIDSQEGEREPVVNPRYRGVAN